MFTLQAVWDYINSHSGFALFTISEIMGLLPGKYKGVVDLILKIVTAAFKDKGVTNAQ